MNINGEEMTSDAIKDLIQLKCTATPESEAEFEKREQERLHYEGLERIKKSNEYANIPKIFWTSRFTDFPNDFTETAKKICLDQQSNKVVLLLGQVGRGKTTTLSSAIHERAYNGLMSSMYFSMCDLLLELDERRRFSSEESVKQWINKLCTVEQLFLDELGTCPNGYEEYIFLNEVYMKRFNNNLTTWGAGNISPIEFKALLCNKDIHDLTKEQLEVLSKKMDAENPVLNRIKSVMVVAKVFGESFREAHNDSYTIQ